MFPSQNCGLLRLINITMILFLASNFDDDDAYASDKFSNISNDVLNIVKFE